MDIPTVEPKRMPSELRLYDVVVNGYTTRMRLNAADAERLNASPVDGPADDSAEPTDAPVRKARTKTQNRARTAEDDK